MTVDEQLFCSFQVRPTPPIKSKITAFFDFLDPKAVGEEGQVPVLWFELW